MDQLALGWSFRGLVGKREKEGRERRCCSRAGAAAKADWVQIVEGMIQIWSGASAPAAYWETWDCMVARTEQNENCWDALSSCRGSREGKPSRARTVFKVSPYLAELHENTKLGWGGWVTYPVTLGQDTHTHSLDLFTCALELEYGKCSIHSDTTWESQNDLNFQFWYSTHSYGSKYEESEIGLCGKGSVLTDNMGFNNNTVSTPVRTWVGHSLQPFLHMSVFMRQRKNKKNKNCNSKFLRRHREPQQTRWRSVDYLRKQSHCVERQVTIISSQISCFNTINLQTEQWDKSKHTLAWSVVRLFWCLMWTIILYIQCESSSNLYVMEIISDISTSFFLKWVNFLMPTVKTQLQLSPLITVITTYVKAIISTNSIYLDSYLTQAKLNHWLSFNAGANNMWAAKCIK